MEMENCLYSAGVEFVSKSFYEAKLERGKGGLEDKYYRLLLHLHRQTTVDRLLCASDKDELCIV